MLRRGIALHAPIRSAIARRALSTVTEGSSPSHSTVSQSSPSVDNDVASSALSSNAEPERVVVNNSSAYVVVNKNIHSLDNLFAVIRCVEKYYGPIADFRCPTEMDSRAFRGRIFVRFQHSSSVERLAGLSKSEKSFTVRMPRRKDGLLEPPEGLGLEELSSFVRRNSDVPRANLTDELDECLEITIKPNSVDGTEPKRRSDFIRPSSRALATPLSTFTGLSPTPTPLMLRVRDHWAAKADALGSARNEYTLTGSDLLFLSPSKKGPIPTSTATRQSRPGQTRASTPQRPSTGNKPTSAKAVVSQHVEYVPLTAEQHKQMDAARQRSTAAAQAMRIVRDGSAEARETGTQSQKSSEIVAAVKETRKGNLDNRRTQQSPQLSKAAQKRIQMIKANTSTKPVSQPVGNARQVPSPAASPHFPPSLPPNSASTTGEAATSGPEKKAAGWKNMFSVFGRQ